MRIVIHSFGTRGDLAPFTGLGARLQQAGHEVAVGVHESFAPMVRAAGLEHRPLAGDVRALLAGDTGRELERGGAGVRWMTRTMSKAGSYNETMNQLGESIAEASRDADLLLLHRGTLFHGYVVAKAMGIRSMLTDLFPSSLAVTGEFPPVMFGARSFGRWGNRALATGFPRLVSPLLGFAKDFQRRMGVPAVGLSGTYREIDRSRWPILHGFSPLIVPRPADWRPGIDVVGYWWPRPDPAWQPPAELVDFLESGPPPVYFGFGSMAQNNRERLSEVVTEVVRRTKVRAVVQAGWSGLSAAGDDVLAIGDAPHEWLFPRMAAVVHHGGAGTTGAGLRAGVPAVAVTVLGDQPFWGERMTRAGVSPGWTTLNSLTAERLAELVGAAVTDPAHQRRARELAEGIATEDGAGRVVDVVSRMES
ncbi:glycosyltransferase [Saccharopolyspora taberi]|uniref:Glycosyltransferase n=1 Tax=Saccharopolyspora taberi TaxID=60895 RepID=A0ABN3VJT8_9PSEU